MYGRAMAEVLMGRPSADWAVLISESSPLGETRHIPVRRSASNKYLQIDERIRSRFAHTHLRTGISRRIVIRCSP
jgi:hypothetical protein